MRTPDDGIALLAAGLLPSLAYLSLGLLALRCLGLRAGGAERLALAFVVGSGLASLLLLGLRAADLPVPLWSCGALALLALPLLRGEARRAAPAPPAARLLDGGAAAAAALTFLSALAPETFWDGFEYHLPIAQAWAEGPIRALPGMLDAELRAGVDLLYIPALSAGQPDAAAGVSAAFAIALAVQVRAEVARRSTAAVGAWAGLFTLLAPFTVENAASAYVDLAVGAYGFQALRSAARGSRCGSRSELLLAALCLGFAANAKLHALLLAPAVLALACVGGRRPSLAEACGGGALVLAVVAPWVLKTALTTGNPLFPFFGETFGYGPSDAAHLAAKRGDVYHYVRVERSAAGLLWYLSSLTFGRAYHIGGLLGPLPLALAPLAVSRPSRESLCLAVMGALFLAFQFALMPAVRFGAPWLPWLAVATAVGGDRLARSGAGARSALGAALAAVLLLHGAWLLRAHLPRVAALAHPDAYRLASFPDQVALAEMVARAEPIVAIPRGAVAWMPHPVYNLHWSRNGELFFDARGDPDEALSLLQRRGVRSLVLAVDPRALAQGRLGHPIADAWLERGRAHWQRDPDPPAAQRGRVWVLLRLRSDRLGRDS